jgi:ferric-dicitrate binding protein FerR (iron transport regulator)
MKELFDKSLLMSYLEGRIGLEDKTVVEEWLQSDPANGKELLDTARICHALRTHSRIHTRDTQSSFIRVDRKIARLRLKVWLGRVAGAAACIAVGIALSTFFFQTESKGSSVYHTIEVPSGQRVKLTLADGSLVWLNAQTKFAYPAVFDKHARRVTLDGEGLFEIAHDADRPFTVQTAKYSVTALGTTFDVYAYNNSNAFETTLIEGAVEVASRDSAGRVTDTRRMKPGSKLWFDEETQQLQTAEVETDNYISWTNGIYCFNDITFAEVAKRLEHYYKTQIIINDSSVMNYRCTGKFRQHESITDIMDVIKSDMPFSYLYDREINTLTIAGQGKRKGAITERK